MRTSSLLAGVPLPSLRPRTPVTPPGSATHTVDEGTPTNLGTMIATDMTAMAASPVGRQAVSEALAALTDQVSRNSDSMDVFFILVSGYLVFLMQTVRARRRV